MNPFKNRNVPFEFKDLCELPKKYYEYLPFLNDRVAIIEDCIYSTNTEILGKMKATVNLIVVSQKDRKPREIDYRPSSLAYGAALIIQNGEIIKNHLQ